ncbi:bis(5'-nucleosyl)-tetraphosphatase [asymmetrical]-like [Patiria miniata]|uniref:Bis(5'-nucleosyl)-tetraphosphatase [asymmetrical] n=1 Tax=Patiria miniata TaxID=46514 RepID=A0A914BSR8_PATMI|nr:bis(5'-nucleosyl)-tetraphosphatase [asymmetrical]-like [Patiria miniata]
MMASVDIIKAGGLLVFRKFKQEVQYLMLQKSSNHTSWAPPKGHVDPGETVYETALRETAEEAGLLPEHLNIHKDICWTIRYQTKKAKPKEVVFWLAQMKDCGTPVVLSNEHQAYKWLGVAKARAIAKYRDTKGMLEEAEKYINQ